MLVEYEAIFPKFGIAVEYKPKLRADNTIIISPSKTYTSSDFKVIMATYCKQNNMMDKYDSIALFLEENL